MRVCLQHVVVAIMVLIVATAAIMVMLVAIVADMIVVCQANVMVAEQMLVVQVAHAQL